MWSPTHLNRSKGKKNKHQTRKKLNFSPAWQIHLQTPIAVQNYGEGFCAALWVLWKATPCSGDSREVSAAQSGASLFMAATITWWEPACLLYDTADHSTLHLELHMSALQYVWTLITVVYIWNGVPVFYVLWKSHFILGLRLSLVDLE